MTFRKRNKEVLGAERIKRVFSKVRKNADESKLEYLEVVPEIVE